MSLEQWYSRKLTLESKFEFVLIYAPDLQREFFAEMRALALPPGREEGHHLRVQWTLFEVYSYIANSRFCSRVFLFLKEISAQDPVILYGKLRKLHWEKIIPLERTLAVESTAKHNIRNSSADFINLKAKDAICDEIRKHKQDRRPNVDRANPDVLVRLHYLENGKAQVMFDFVGFPLHRRGYKIDIAHFASLKEHKALGILAKVDYTNYQNIIDPFCGSGTLMFEGAMATQGDLPSKYHSEYTYEKLNFPKAKYAKVKSSKESQAKFWGSDKDKKLIEKDQLISTRVELDTWIDFKVCKAQEIDWTAWAGKNALCVFNPPFGKRLEENIGTLKAISYTIESCRDNRVDVAFIYPTEMSAQWFDKYPLKKVGTISNGTIPCDVLSLKHVEEQ